MQTSERPVLTIGIEDRLPLHQAAAFGLQHLLALTGIWIFPALAGRMLGLDRAEVGALIQACFLTTGIVTIIQSSRLLKLPVVQGPTPIFMMGLVIAGQNGSLGIAFGSMAVAALIFAFLALPLRGYSLMAFVLPYVATPLVFGTLLLIIGTQLAAFGLPGWFAGASPVTSFTGALLTAAVVLTALICGGDTILRRGAILVGLAVGTAYFASMGSLDIAAVWDAPVLGTPHLLAYGFGISWPLVGMMMLGFLQATAESAGMYGLLGRWGGQEVGPERTSRGLFGEYLGCAVGALFGGLGTTAYAENVGIVRVTGVGSRFATMAAGMFALALSFLPMVGVAMASLPGAVLAGASTVLFGIIAMSGVQMMQEVEWDELNLAVASTSFIVAIGVTGIPAAALDGLAPIMRSIVTQPMLVGTVLLVIGNLIANGVIRPKLERRGAPGELRARLADQ
jgi:xanthine/uracil permease